MPDDTQNPLNEHVLRCSKHLESRDMPDGIQLLKQTQLANYLALSKEQQALFAEFDGERNVQQVLHELLQKQERPNLRSFYDFVVTAVERGFLVPAGEEETQDAESAPLRTLSLPFGWGYAAAIILSGIMIAGGIFFIRQVKYTIPLTAGEWLLALIVISVGMSLSGVLSGFVLKGFSRVVYGPSINLKRVIPYVAVDTRDGFMGGRKCEISTALQASATPFLIIAAGAVLDNGVVVFAAVLTAFILLCPVGATPGADLIHAIFRKQSRLRRLSTRFLGRRLIVQLWRFVPEFFSRKKDKGEENYMFVFVTCTLIWLGTALQFGGDIIRSSGSALVWDLEYAPELSSRLFAGVSLAITGILIAGPLLCQVWVVLQNLFQLLRPRLFSTERRIAKRNRAPESQATVEEVLLYLKDSLLFAQLSEEVLKAVAAAMTPLAVKPETEVIRQGESGQALYMITTGRARIEREDEFGETRIVAGIGPGDVFGEIALIDDIPRTSTVVSDVPLTLLQLERTDFERLVLDQLGAETVRTTIQICGFLRKCDMFSGWHNQALMSIALRFKFLDVDKDEKVIDEDGENDRFFLIYEGRFQVSRGDKPIVTLGTGDYFGEISLLRNTPAISTVAAVEPSRCLILTRDEFLEFVSHDFLTGYAIEGELEQRMSEAGV